MICVLFQIFFNGLARLLCAGRLKDGVVFVRDHGYRKAMQRTNSDEHLNQVQYTVRRRYNAVTQIFAQIFAPHTSPIRARYGVPYGVHKKASDWYFASVPVVIHVISWNIEPYHNGTRLYIQWHRICTWFCCALFRCGCAISQWWIHKDTLPLFVRIALPTLEILMIFLLSVKQFWRIRAKLTIPNHNNPNHSKLVICKIRVIYYGEYTWQRL